MQQKEEISFSRWVVSMLIITSVGACVYQATVKSKLDVCEAYYPEISAMSCFFSSFGLPSVGIKR